MSCFTKILSELIPKTKRVYKEIGCRLFVCTLIFFILDKLIFDRKLFILYRVAFHKKARLFTFFILERKLYLYFFHEYNETWTNEREIEIPIIWNIVKRFRGKRILEFGNVLSHYFPINHDVVDKYEKAANVINQDIVNFTRPYKYDLIISISTIEHVGWDEYPRIPEKILSAIENLKNLIAPKGKIVITLPLGYNIEMDKLLKSEKIFFTRKFLFQRVSKYNFWKKVDWSHISDLNYNCPYFHANGLVIGIIDN